MCPDIEELQLISKKKLLALVPRSYSSIWNMMRRGEFPLSVRIGDRVYWRWTEVEKWLDELPRSEYRGVEEPGNPDRGLDQ